MKRNDCLPTTESVDSQDLIYRIAYHEAGHAAGIHLHNKQKQLPSVFFQIVLKNAAAGMPSAAKARFGKPIPFIAEIEGGRLTETLPIDVLESSGYFSLSTTDAYRTALEADIVNLLIGAAAEAKHVALRETNRFDRHAVGLASLLRYGGASDLAEAYHYLEHSIASQQRREEKMAELFDRALDFITEPAHWCAIEHLADYLLIHKEQTVGCEKAIAVLEEAVYLKKSLHPPHLCPIRYQSFSHSQPAPDNPSRSTA
ncbi:hypothetical protein [Methylosarcina fibrata]|uniref:hypothetical protein n=1 Tax=Methylosarcina fibrata TaxID=105972 RepID=UPI0003A53F50|nr:hypothetical protein [Methylosarcina fibrata]